MKLLSFVFAFAAFGSAVAGVAAPNDNHAATLEGRSLEKRAFLPVTGVQTGGVQSRLEIRQLAAKGNQWTIFLLAMKQLQAKPQSAKTSYYQISGIHGTPRQNWDDVGQCSTCNADGYCTHDSILFLGWHRAYILLLEQELVKVARTIAAKYPAATRADMQAAANNLRMPYWDWAAKPASGNTIPASMTDPQVTVNGPKGSTTFANPLHHFTFKNPSKLRYTPFTTWTKTLRYPTSSAKDAASDMTQAINKLNNIRVSMRDQVYNMFSTCDEFVEVGSDAAGQSSIKCSNSLENIHNTIHTTTGGPKAGASPGGHMTFLSTAAFDPAFWLHHTNIDRLFAMWQAMYPNSYGGSQVAPHNTWTIAQGTTQNAGSPLTPFHKNAGGDFLTTNDVRDTKAYGYTYPEFANSNGSKNAIASYINKLYSPTATGTAGSSKRDAIPEPEPKKKDEKKDKKKDKKKKNKTKTGTKKPKKTKTKTGTQPTQTAPADDTPLLANNGSTYQYTANIQTGRYALNGSYVVILFNGDPEDDEPTSWLNNNNIFGPMGLPSSTEESAMSSSNLVAVGSVPLTTVLTQEFDSKVIKDLTKESVVPYLTEKLMWRVIGPKGEAVDPESIPDFEVSVWQSTSTRVDDFTLPVWSEFIPLAEITRDSPGGATAASIEARRMRMM